VLEKKRGKRKQQRGSFPCKLGSEKGGSIRRKRRGEFRGKKSRWILYRCWEKGEGFPKSKDLRSGVGEGKESFQKFSVAAHIWHKCKGKGSLSAVKGRFVRIARPSPGRGERSSLEGEERGTLKDLTNSSVL